MNIQLYFREKGTGIPLILLHGNGEDCRYFDAQVEHFSKNYQVIALDTRGHGHSPRGTAPFTIRQFAQDLSRFMDAHSIPSAILLGFSDGANIALCFALAYPQKVRALILNGGNLDPSGLVPRVLHPMLAQYQFARLLARRSEKARAQQELLGLMVNDPALTPADLAAICAPTLVIAGDRDVIRKSHTRQIAAAIPEAQLVILPGDHFIAQKNPQAFNRAVEEFLKDGFL